MMCDRCRTPGVRLSETCKGECILEQFIMANHAESRWKRNKRRDKKLVSREPDHPNRQSSEPLTTASYHFRELYAIGSEWFDYPPPCSSSSCRFLKGQGDFLKESSTARQRRQLSVGVQQDKENIYQKRRFGGTTEPFLLIFYNDIVSSKC